MLYSKECVSGRSIDLSMSNLGVIRQLIVEDFMYNYELVDFVKPFYLEQTWSLNEEFKKSNIPFTYFIFLSSQNEQVMPELIKALQVLYETNDIKLIKYDENDFKILIKKNDKAIAYVDDSNFDILCEAMLVVNHFDKPKPEPIMKGDPELVEKMKKARAKYDKEHKSKDTLTFEGMVRDVLYYRSMVYEDIKDWTIWQVKDVYIAESIKDSEDKQWLLASSGNYKIDKIKRWQDEVRIVHE